MCYRVTFLKKKAHDYAKHYGETEPLIEEMEKELNLFQQKLGGPVYQTIGYDYPELPVITNEEPQSFQFLTWGLIPAWANAESAAKIRNSTLNARSETMFQLGSFKRSASSRRCLVVVDGYFDHHHHSSKKKIPYFIKMKNDEPMTLAGLWDRWHDNNSDLEMETVTIVTTSANETMRKIHNNPEMLKREHSEKSRMPVIIPREIKQKWITSEIIEDKLDQKKLLDEICQPYPNEELVSFPVAPLNLGREIVNSPNVNQPFNYPELQQKSLF